MNTILGFFSSDSRPLYVEDIYKVLALPYHNIIHFRYDQKYVDDDVKMTPASFVGKKGIIFFAIGNDLNKKEEDRNIKTYSIRKVTIKDIERGENTEIFHFYLQLEDFVDCTVVTRDNGKFVSKISISDGTKHKWIDRVRVVKDADLFKERTVFFNFSIASRKNERIDPIYNATTRTSVYHLSDESIYIIKISYFDTCEGSSYVNIEDAEVVKVKYKDRHGLGAVIDDRSYELCTGTLIRHQLPEELRFRPAINNSKTDLFQCEIIARFVVRRQYSKLIKFGLLSGSAFVPVLIAQLFGELVKTAATPMWLLIITGISPVLILGFCASQLFSQFNKK